MPARTIAFGITDLDIGGAEHIMVELATRLDRTRWNPTVVCLQPAGPLAEKLRDCGIPVESLEMRGVRDTYKALRRWTAILKEQRPAILQTFLFHANLLGRFAGRRAGVPRIVSGLRVAEHRRNLHVTMDRMTRWKVDAFVCVSEGVADFARHSLKIPERKLVVIPNGVDCESAEGATPVDRATFGCSSTDIVLMFVGRFDRQKGLMDLLYAVAMDSKLPEADRLKIVLVGDGPEIATIEGSIGRLNLQGHFRLVGWQPNVWDWLASADGLVLPSRWEGMPNVVLQAMASRLPVIATNVEGSRELVVPNSTGWLVDPSSLLQLSDAILEFVSSPNRRQMGDAGRAIVEEHYTFDKMVASYERLYDRLIEG